MDETYFITNKQELDMTQENKELLLKDICARLPYGIKCEYHNLRYGGVFKVTDIRYNGYIEGVIDNKRCWAVFDTFALKPYLFPMSSMTEEEFTKLKEYSGLKYDQLDLVSFQNGTYKCLNFYLSEVPSGAVIRVFDWLNTYHFDYRDLIQMGLAIDATNLNIY